MYRNRELHPKQRDELPLQVRHIDERIRVLQWIVRTQLIIKDLPKGSALDEVVNELHAYVNTPTVALSQARESLKSIQNSIQELDTLVVEYNRPGPKRKELFEKFGQNVQTIGEVLRVVKILSKLPYLQG